MLRIIGEARPTWVVAENVSALVRMGIDTCLLGLEAEGYTTRTLVFPACSVGAVHRRERVFIVAYLGREFSGRDTELGRLGSKENSAEDDSRVVADACRERRQQESRCTSSDEGENGRQPNRDNFAQCLEQDGDSRSAIDYGSCGLPRESRRRPGEKSQNGHSQLQKNDWRNWKVKPVFRRNDDGLPPGLDGPSVTARLRALGNAVDPYQAYPILKAIAAMYEARK